MLPRWSVVAAILLVLFAPTAARCMTDEHVRGIAESRCAATNSSTVPAPDAGTTLLNGEPVDRIECSRIDAYEFRVDCDLPRPVAPWKQWAGIAALLVLLPAWLAVRRSRRRGNTDYLAVLLVAALVPGSTAAAMNTLNLSGAPAYLALLAAFVIPVAAGVAAVRRGAERRTVAAIVVLAAVLSFFAGGMATMPVIVMV